MVKKITPLGILGVIVLVIISLVIYAFVSGKIKYHETLRLPGESRGYIGRDPKILESEESIKEVFDKLKNKKEFKGSDVYFLELSLNNERFYSVVQDPNIKSNFDDYDYYGTSLIKPSWGRGEPHKLSVFDEDSELIDINRLSPKGINKFYTKVSNYLKEHNVELSEDYVIQIRVNNDSSLKDYSMKLTSSVSGKREDFTFESDLNGENFQVK